VVPSQVREPSFLERLLTKPSNRQFAVLFVFLGVLGYAFAVRLPSLGHNFLIYTSFGSFVNANGRLPSDSDLVSVDRIPGYYADFPALSLRIYQALSLVGEEPNRFLWAAYFLLPLVLVLLATALRGPSIGLSPASARALALVGLAVGTWTARFFEDKAHFLWIPLLAFLLMSVRPWLSAAVVGLFTGWTGLLPLGPLYPAIRAQGNRIVLFGIAALAAALALLAAGTWSIDLLQNRAARETGETFWFGFWQYLPFLDNSPTRTAFGLLASAFALLAYQRRWVSFPAAVSASTVFVVTASNSFQHTRIWMLLPLVVFLMPSVRSQVWYLLGLFLWSCIPLIDFAGYGYVFAGSGITPTQYALVVIFTNVPVFFAYAAFVFAVVRGIRLKLPPSCGPFQPSADVSALLGEDSVAHDDAVRR
jgi:hypothetical protein